MKKFRDPNRIPCVPKSWRGTLPNGTDVRIPWPCTIPFGAFYSQVSRFYSDNGATAPSAETVIDFICQQLPSQWCVGSDTYIAPAPQRAPCKSCGRW